MLTKKTFNEYYCGAEGSHVWPLEYIYGAQIMRKILQSLFVASAKFTARNTRVLRDLIPISH